MVAANADVNAQNRCAPTEHVRVRAQVCHKQVQMYICAQLKIRGIREARSLNACREASKFQVWKINTLSSLHCTQQGILCKDICSILRGNPWVLCSNDHYVSLTNMTIMNLYQRLVSQPRH
jgi:hypothetical protein